ncbi:MFS transporter [Paraburkholderia sp. MPAMCS5]|uniref:MFS transporter n=1 Tax=Paraburkholderia sp. MPAMCS5 TaxID=3112563 RepID=UPI002E18E098|nr:MFS transporter [Paraburkholderia sp. MPAMCS5]
MTRRQRWTIFIASAGGALETFDFVIYGFFAQEIGREFFPLGGGASAVTLSFAVFAIGYLSRPLGGLFLGRLGDKYGRRLVFAAAAIVAALSTLFIALLPSYRAWGVAAPALMLLLRLTQGVCVGGELSGAVVYAVETTRTRPGFLCGIVFFAVNISLLLAAGINLFVQATLTSAEVLRYGWRIGFFVGGLIGLLSFFVRRTLPETDAFARAEGVRHREPLAVLFRRHLAPLATGIAATTVVGVSNGLFVAHAPTYLRQLNYAPQQIATAQTLYVIVIALCMLVTAKAGDLLPRRYVFRAGAVVTAVFAPCFYAAVSRGQADLFTWFVLAAIVAAFANGTFACAIAEMFPIGVRYSGLGAAMNLGLAATMGTAPLAATILIARTQWNAAPALVMMSCAGLAFVASFAMKPSRAEESRLTTDTRECT